MSKISEDLEAFLDVVRTLTSSIPDTDVSPAELRAALDGAGLRTLASDTADEPDSCQWLTHTVRVAAQTSPTVGFLLAARYAADRALTSDSSGASGLEPSFCLLSPGASTVLATGLSPHTVVAVDVAARQLVRASWDDVAPSAVHDARTGLDGARFVSITLHGSAAACSARSDDALVEWDLLTGAVLAGLARRAVAVTQSYVSERHQFGVPISTFAGLRALVAEMDLRASAIEALLESATNGSAPSDALAATAGRAAIEICLGAIQAHGGYGYIDEYPLAGLLRDAISVQARSGGRRLHVARLAERTLGPAGAGRF